MSKTNEEKKVETQEGETQGKEGQKYQLGDKFEIQGGFYGIITEIRQSIDGSTRYEFTYFTEGSVRAICLSATEMEFFERRGTGKSSGLVGLGVAVPPIAKWKRGGE